MLPGPRSSSLPSLPLCVSLFLHPPFLHRGHKNSAAPESPPVCTSGPPQPTDALCLSPTHAEHTERAWSFPIFCFVSKTPKLHLNVICFYHHIDRFRFHWNLRRGRATRRIQINYPSVKKVKPVWMGTSVFFFTVLIRKRRRNVKGQVDELIRECIL